MDDADWGPALWESAAWLDTAAGWIDERLRAVDRLRTGPCVRVRVCRWATVTRAETGGGAVWMKAMRPATAFEAGLYGVVEDAAPGLVPHRLAADPDRGWLLLEDGGEAIAATPQAMAEALPVYAELQRALASRTDELLAAGVEDMRPAALPQRLDQALALGAGGDRRSELEDLRPTVGRWCEELEAAPGPASIDHNDLYPANVLPGPRFFDWGDSVVAHPFTSLHDTLASVTEGHDLMRDAYLEAWTDLAPRRQLERTLELALRLSRIARSLTMIRAFEPHPEEQATDDWMSWPQDTLAGLLDPS